MAPIRSLPPELTPALISRPRLLQTMRRRYEVGALAVVAPAGYGKSILLAQAIRDNSINPRGIDRWICADPVVGRPERLSEALDRAVANRGDDPVTVVVDQAEHISDPEPLVELRRRCGDLLHLVVAGRCVPAGLDPDLSLTAADLELGEAEIEQLAASVGGDAASTHWAGRWPAVRALALRHQAHLAVEYALEEVFANADADERARLVQREWRGPLASAAAKLDPVAASADLTADAEDRSSVPDRDSLGHRPSEPDVLFKLTGQPAILYRGREIESDAWRRSRVRQLVALLALRGELDRDEASRTFWPSLDDVSRRRNLSVTLTHVRRLLRSLDIEQLVDERGGRLRWREGATVQSDLGRAVAATQGNRPDDPQRVDALAALAGEPVVDLADVSEAVAMRRDLTERLVGAGVATANALCDRGLFADATDVARAVTLLDPYDDRGVVCELRAAIGLGDVGLARSAAARCRKLFAELDVEPDPSVAAMLDEGGR